MKIKSLILLTLFLAPLTLLSFSNATLSEKDYRYTLTLIREMDIVIKNFGTEDEQKEFEAIRANFQIAAERHYARNFITSVSLSDDTKPDSTAKSSVDLFYELKLQLLDMYEKMADFYLFRTKSILDENAKQATNILIEYGKGGGLSKYFFGRPVDPLKDNKPYDSDKYHFFHMRSTIEQHLDSGYRYLEEARIVYNDVDYQYILTKESMTSNELNYMIDKHRAVIAKARNAKECGIEIYKTLKVHDTSAILEKYDVSQIYMKRYPIYDDRIPENYKVDATDNRKLIFAIEKKRIGNYDTLNPDSKEDTDPNKQREGYSFDKEDEDTSSTSTPAATTEPEAATEE